MAEWKQGITDSRHKCKLCKREMGTHNASTGACIVGKKTAFSQFSNTDFFAPSDKKPSAPKFSL